MHKILSPYLTQFEPASVNRVQRELIRRRCRPAWKLFIETLLLCSPLVVARNWHRRWRGRYPVLIFTHHLVTDRIHRMGLSTEIFWDQVRYWNLRGGEFGSHTHTHFDCGYADRKRLEAEIIGSKNILESHLTKPVRFFAFPFGGQRNISSKAMQLAAFTYPHVLSDFGGENLPDIGRSKGHLFRKNFYSNLWELELELQSVFDLVAARQKFSLGRANSSSSPNRLIGASAFNTRRNASSSSSRIDASRHHGSPVQ